MPRWPLLLPPPAVSTSTSPSRSRGSSSHHCAVPRRRVAVAVAPSLAVVPRPPSPSIRHRAVHRCPSPLCSRSTAAALAPSLAVEEPLHRPLPSRSRCSRRPLLSPSRSRCAVHCRRGAVAPYLAIKEQLSGWLSRLLASHAATSHLPAPPPLTLIAPSSPLVTPLLLLSLSSSWLTA